MSVLFMHLYMVMHMTLMSPTLNDPFTNKFPLTWWQRIHQVTQRPGMYRKLGFLDRARFGCAWKRDQTKRQHKDCWQATDEATDSKVYPCTGIDIGEVLFHYVMFATKKMRIFQARFIAFFPVESPKICWTFRHISLVPVDKRNS